LDLDLNWILVGFESTSLDLDRIHVAVVLKIEFEIEIQFFSGFRPDSNPIARIGFIFRFW